jgi:hypothetical protein
MAEPIKKRDNGRDEKGHFKPGHTLFREPDGIKSGRPKSLKGQVLDALCIAEDAMPRLIKDMIRDAEDATVSVHVRQQCREYLCDRIYGKPNQPLSGGLTIIEVRHRENTAIDAETHSCDTETRSVDSES